MSFLERVWRKLSGEKRDVCTWCGREGAPIRPPESGPYRYCSQECVEADADHQADQI